jgi:hypothetical protein
MEEERVCVSILAVVLLGLLAGCATEESRWKRAKSTNTIEAYADLISRYPKGAFADSARQRIEQMEFEQAERANTESAWQGFLKSHPQGAHADSARSRFEDLRTAELIDALVWMGLQNFTSARHGTAIGQFQTHEGQAAQAMQLVIADSFTVDSSVPAGAVLARQGYGRRVKKLVFFSPDQEGMAVVLPDRAILKVGSDWRKPFEVEMDGGRQLPEIRFRRADISWDSRSEKVLVSEGAEAKVGDRAFEYGAGHWQPLIARVPATP